MAKHKTVGPQKGWHKKANAVKRLLLQFSVKDNFARGAKAQRKRKVQIQLKTVVGF